MASIGHRYSGYRIVRDFVSGEKIKDRLASIFIPHQSGNTVYSYGYHWPLVVKQDDGSVLLNVERRSRTTNHHARNAEMALRDLGFHQVEDEVTIPHYHKHTFVKFAK